MTVCCIFINPITKILAYLYKNDRISFKSELIGQIIHVVSVIEGKEHMFKTLVTHSQMSRRIAAGFLNTENCE